MHAIVAARPQAARSRDHPRRHDDDRRPVRLPDADIEAYPDPVPPLVDVITQNPGQSSEEIERYITVPIEIQMAGLPYVQAIRTISLFGLSDVKVQFHLRREATSRPRRW